MKARSPLRLARAHEKKAEGERSWPDTVEQKRAKRTRGFFGKRLTLIKWMRSRTKPVN